MHKSPASGHLSVRLSQDDDTEVSKSIAGAVCSSFKEIILASLSCPFAPRMFICTTSDKRQYDLMACIKQG